MGKIKFHPYKRLALLLLHECMAWPVPRGEMKPADHCYGPASAPPKGAGPGGQSGETALLCMRVASPMMGHAKNAMISERKSKRRAKTESTR